jgi:beta propeller repeat protein
LNAWASPIISGNIVVYTDGGNVYGADISNPDAPIIFQVSDSNGNETSPAISGNIIVWADYRNGNYDIYGYDLSTSTEFQITDNESWQIHPAIYDHTVVWEDWRNGQKDIYASIIYGPDVPQCISFLRSDLNGDCKVDFQDFSIFMQGWLDCNLDPPEACSQ